MRVASIGECMVEFSAATDGLFARGFGGDTLNTALYLARLGVDTSYVTALGDDSLSEAMLAAWKAEGIKTDEVVCPGVVSGTRLIITDESASTEVVKVEPIRAHQDSIRAPGTES
jgi:2-dehydro-3-deoxygluconokinase